MCVKLLSSPVVHCLTSPINWTLSGLKYSFFQLCSNFWSNIYHHHQNDLTTNRDGKAKTLKSQGLSSAKQAVDSLNLFNELIFIISMRILIFMRIVRRKMLTCSTGNVKWPKARLQRSRPVVEESRPQSSNFKKTAVVDV